MFQIVDTPIALPGCCYLCGGADKAPYIDWGVSIEFHGALYTCFECTGAVSSLLGWVPREKHDELLKINDELMADSLTKTIENHELKQAILHLKEAGFIVNESIPDPNVEPSGTVADFDSDFSLDSEPSNEATRDSDELLDFGKRTSDESSNDEGMDELHSDDSFSDFRFKI